MTANHKTTETKHDSSTSEAVGVSNTEKDPSDWVTGDEPMTGAQHSYLKTLSDEAGVAFDDKLTKGEASKKIDELRKSNPRTQ